MPLELISPSDNEINKVDISCYSEYGNVVEPPKSFYIANSEPISPSDNEIQKADVNILNDLIHRDVSRCNDDKCPTSVFCERYLQMSIDYKKGEKLVSVTDFKGRKKKGLCDYFLNVSVPFTH